MLMGMTSFNSPGQRPRGVLDPRYQSLILKLLVFSNLYLPARPGGMRGAFESDASLADACRFKSYKDSLERRELASPNPLHARPCSFRRTYAGPTATRSDFFAQLID